MKDSLNSCKLNGEHDHRHTLKTITLTNFVAKTVFAVCAWFARSKSLGLVPLAGCTASGWPIPALVNARYWNGGSDNTKRKLGNITIASTMMQRAIQRRWRIAAPLLRLAAVLCLGSATSASAQLIGGPTIYVSGGLFPNTPTNQPLLYTWLSHIEIRGDHWNTNSTIPIHLYGPLNTLGAQPIDRVVGMVYADNAGSISPGIDYDPYVMVPYDNGTNGISDVTRPGNYQVYAWQQRKFQPLRVYSQHFNICPRTTPFTTFDTNGFQYYNNWVGSRGGRDGWLGDDSPERSDPEWISVWSEQPVGIYGTVAPTDVRPDITDPPANQPSFIASSDLPFTHYGHDWNVDLVPDPDYRWVLADANFFSETVPGKSNNGRIECEWETLNNGTPFYGSYGHGNIGLPVWAMPTSGDRVYMVGRWALDNGHPDGGDRTEIHPPRLLATMRKRNTAAPFGDPASACLTRASQVDIYVSGHGGGANKFPDGLSAALNNHGAGGGRIEDVLSAADLATYFAWGPADSHIYDAVLSVLQWVGSAPTGDIKPTAGPSAFGWVAGPEQRPVNDMDYDFDVPLPPPPNGATHPMVQAILRPENTATRVSEMVTYTSPDPSTGLPTQAHIHLPYNNPLELGIFARTLYFYWDTYSAPGTHFIVELNDVKMSRAFVVAGYIGPQPQYLWADICGQWVSLTDLDSQDLLYPHLNNDPGFDQAVFSPSLKFDVYLDSSETLRVFAQGYGQRDFDNYFGVDVGLPAYIAGLHLANSELNSTGNNANPGGALFDSPIATTAQFEGVQGYHTNVSQNAVFTVDFNVTFVPRPGRASLQGTPPEFGQPCVGSSQDRSIRISNTGQTPLVISSLNVTGDGFSLVSPPSLPITITAGGVAGYVDLTVRFAPTAVSQGAGALNIGSSDPCQPLNIPLTATVGVYTLATNVSGSGAVARNPDRALYDCNAPVTVTATPSPGWGFLGWSGDASGMANPLNLTMTTNKTITAIFFEPTLTANAGSGGSVIKTPNQTICPYNSTVTLTALPVLGWTFTGWSGDASGLNNPLSLIMTTNKVVTASFASNFPDLIVDNTNATFTGSWTTDSGSVGTGFSGQDYAYALTVSTASATAQFRPNLPVGGNYDVYVWFPFISQNNKRCSDAEYLISSAGGTNTVSVNQKSSSFGWFQIASGQKFSSGTAGYVQLSNQSTDVGRDVAADAVRWVWSANQVTQPYITSVTSGAGNATLTWLSGSNYVYRLLYKTNLADAAWLDVSGDVMATTGTASKTVSTPGNALRGFYRVELLP